MKEGFAWRASGREAEMGFSARGACAIIDQQISAFGGMSPLELSLLIEPSYRDELDAALIEKAVSCALETEGARYATEVSVAVTGDEAVAELNQRFRGKTGTTDVLSFAMSGGDVGEGGFVSPPSGKQDLGEVIISYPQAKRQAEGLGHDTRDEIAFLTIHGVFHLLGYDHEIGSEAELMKEMETRALGEMGIKRSSLSPERQVGDRMDSRHGAPSTSPEAGMTNRGSI